MKTFAIIPTKYESPQTLEMLIANISRDKGVYRAYILNNTTEELWRKSDTLKIRSVDFPNYSVYEMWNSMWDYIPHVLPPRSKFNLAILNDDIILPESAIGIMADYLRKDESLAAIYPDYSAAEDTKNYSIKYTESTFGHGGMSGFCFMVKGELPFRVDRNLTLYWGDDDLTKQISSAGYKIGRIVGLPLEHAGSATIRKMDAEKRHQIMESDRAYFNKKYNENRGPVW